MAAAGEEMTHDELRDYIDKFDAAGMVNEPAVKALRAVVELHKPNKYFPEFCEVCWWEEHERENYPCQTIQAIEKEFSNG